MTASGQKDSSCGLMEESRTARPYLEGLFQLLALVMCKIPFDTGVKKRRRVELLLERPY